MGESGGPHDWPRGHTKTVPQANAEHDIHMIASERALEVLARLE